MDLDKIRLELESIILQTKGFFYKESSNKLLDVKKKSDKDYVSKTDLEVQNFLIDKINSSIPNIQILSEENINEKHDLSEKCFVIDPLDGTLNYINGISFYCVSIAYVENGTPVIGITYNPLTNDLYVAQKSHGFYINNLKIELQDCNSELIIISNDFLQSCLNVNPNIILELRKFGKIRIFGSQALHIPYVASGKVLACINLEAKYWDDVAGYVMLKEVGFDYINFKGENIFPKSQICPKENLFSISGNKLVTNKIQKLLKDL